MAQEVGWGEDNVVFEEGPFVVVNAGGYRIEVEQKEHHCPVLPDQSIYNLRFNHLNCPKKYKYNNIEDAKKVVDILNGMVRSGHIVLEGKAWVWKGTLPS
jgi:hypothetical protein